MLRPPNAGVRLLPELQVVAHRYLLMDYMLLSIALFVFVTYFNAVVVVITSLMLNFCI